MNLTNIYNLPDAIVRAVKNDPYDPGICDITVTKLISSPRKVQLEKRHAKELTEDVADRVWALLGQAVHGVLERAEVEAVTEKRLSIERQGSVISGQFDRLVVQDRLLQDYKLTSVYAVRDGAKAEWEAQLNILATILREHGYVVKALEVVVILRDWSKSRVGNGDYPDVPIMTISVPIWSEEKSECYIDERIRLHQMAGLELPECSAEERWATPDSWALMKEGRRTAVKLYSDKDEAEAALVSAGNKHYLDHRPGRNVRCEGYCCCARFCDQFQS